MTTFIEILASLVALLGASIGVYRWLRRSRVATVESLAKTKKNFEFYFKEWRATDYPSKHKYIIPWEEFKDVGRHKEVFMAMGNDERIFLHVCAVKNGLWGDWSPGTVRPRHVITALATLLNGKAGWRPKWRAAYLIQQLIDESDSSWVETLPTELQRDVEVIDAIDVIDRRDVVYYLEKISQQKDTYLRDKAFVVLEEIKAYTADSVILKYPKPTRTKR